MKLSVLIAAIATFFGLARAAEPKWLTLDDTTSYWMQESTDGLVLTVRISLPPQLHDVMHIVSHEEGARAGCGAKFDVVAAHVVKSSKRGLERVGPANLSVQADNRFCVVSGLLRFVK